MTGVLKSLSGAALLCHVVRVSETGEGIRRGEGRERFSHKSDIQTTALFQKSSVTKEKDIYVVKIYKEI